MGLTFESFFLLLCRCCVTLHVQHNIFSRYRWNFIKFRSMFELCCTSLPVRTVLMLSRTSERFQYRFSLLAKRGFFLYASGFYRTEEKGCDPFLFGRLSKSFQTPYRKFMRVYGNDLGDAFIPALSYSSSAREKWFRLLLLFSFDDTGLFLPDSFHCREISLSSTLALRPGKRKTNLKLDIGKVSFNPRFLNNSTVWNTPLKMNDRFMRDSKSLICRN